jgi:nitroreductase
MRNLDEIIRARHSQRVPFDPLRRPPEADVQAILEAARWAPTAHNMQNFEILVIDDTERLAEIGRIATETSEMFVRENFAQLSFSEEELTQKGTGLLATMFPPAWRTPGVPPEHVVGSRPGCLADTMRSCPMILIATYDTRTRAPASEGDVLGLISLGCVMQNMWLTAESAGIGMQIMSVFSNAEVESTLRPLLGIPAHMKTAFACRLGYPADTPGRYLQVRRDVSRFTHHNCFDADREPTQRTPA